MAQYSCTRASVMTLQTLQNAFSQQMTIKYMCQHYKLLMFDLLIKQESLSILITLILKYMMIITAAF